MPCLLSYRTVLLRYFRAKAAHGKAGTGPFRGGKRGTYMGKFEGLLLASDFDDTLYDFQHRVPPRNAQAIEYFTREGGRFTVATGRAHRTFAPYLGLTGINAPAVLSNGAAIYDFQTDRPLVLTQLPDTAQFELGELVEAMPELAMEAYFGEDIYVWNPNEITERHMKKVGCGYTLCPVGEMPTPWVKVLFHQRHEVLLEARDWLMSRWWDKYEAVFSNPYYLEITRKGCNKGSMVSKVAQLLGITPDRVYCVGDNQNDIPMLERSAIPFAPANCAQEVRDWGAKILCHCDDGVIGDIVDILDKLY